MNLLTRFLGLARKNHKTRAKADSGVTPDSSCAKETQPFHSISRETDEVRHLVSSGVLPALADYYPCFVQVGGSEGPTTVIFMKQPMDSFQQLKGSVRGMVSMALFSTDRGSLLSLRIEFITHEFLRQLISVIAELRKNRPGTAVVTFGEPKIREAVLDFSNPKDKKTLMQLEGQETWHIVLAPNDLSAFQSFVLKEGLGDQLQRYRSQADAHLSRIPPVKADFDSVRSAFLQKAPPLRSTLFETWTNFDESGCGLVVEDHRVFEEYVLDRVDRLCNFPLRSMY